MFPSLWVVRRGSLLSVLLLTLSLGAVTGAVGQGSASNYTGNGGIHAIQGRIYLSNGRRSDATGIRIRLVNMAASDLSIIADATGAFTFKNLVPGSYTVQVEGGADFENEQETVIIDDPGGSNLGSRNRMRGGTKTATVQIYLRTKAGAPLGSNSVVNAKLAAVPKEARELYEAAQVSMRGGNFDRAATQLREALQLHKEFSLAWNDLGLLLQRSSDLNGAVEAFRFAVKFDPKSPAANLNLGCALYNQKAYAAAENYLMEAIVASPASYRGHYYMGLTQLKLGRLDVAEQAFRKAVDVGDEQAAMAHYMLGGIYWSVKRYKDAASELETYLKLDPNAKDAEKTRASIAELKKKN